MNTLVVLADTGTLKAFSLEESAVNSSPNLEPLDATRLSEGDDRIGRSVTDDAGQFRKSKGRFAVNGDRSDGEQHNIWLENERRSVKQIAEPNEQLWACIKANQAASIRKQKKGIGRQRDYQRTGWPEDAPTQRVGTEGDQEGRDLKAGSPI